MQWHSLAEEFQKVESSKGTLPQLPLLLPLLEAGMRFDGLPPATDHHGFPTSSMNIMISLLIMPLQAGLLSHSVRCFNIYYCSGICCCSFYAIISSILVHRWPPKHQQSWCQPFATAWCNSSISIQHGVKKQTLRARSIFTSIMICNPSWFMAVLW